LHLSVRLPPTCDHQAALKAIGAALTTDPPYGAHVTFDNGHSGPGWNAPAFADWLQGVLDEASLDTFGNESRAFGEGGSIPFMGMLGEMFPDAQFVITGVIGPGANAHGPNEYLHVPMARKVTTCVARILDAHANR
jgi:acetylornithine deacetylase/succinyl-diaminopimelate desuccinylase-like protein